MKKNPLKGSRALLLSVLVPLMFPQVIPEPLRWIWLTLVALVVTFSPETGPPAM